MVFDDLYRNILISIYIYIQISKYLQLSPQMISHITVHGLLLWISMGFLLPAGILFIRMSGREEGGSTRAKVFFYLHVTFQAS